MLTGVQTDVAGMGNEFPLNRLRPSVVVSESQETSGTHSVMDTTSDSLSSV